MRKIYSFLLSPLSLGCLVFLCLILTGCVRDVVLDAGERPKVVVECVLTDSSPQELRLSFTKGASLAEAPELTETTARLIDLTNNYPAGEFRRRDDGIWVLDYAAEPEHNYRLEVEVPGYELVWAEQTMPERIVVERIVEETPPPPISSSTYPITLVSYRIINANTPVWICGILDYGPDKGKMYVERLCADYPDVDVFNLTGDSYTPEIVHFDGSKYASYGSLYGKLLHRRFLRISNASSGQRFFVSGDFPGVYGLDDIFDYPERMYVCFSSFSQDYDRYLKQAFTTVNAGISTDLTSIFARDNFHSNIHGGIGIFGTCSLTTKDWLCGKQYVEVD